MNRKYKLIVAFQARYELQARTSRGAGTITDLFAIKNDIDLITEYTASEKSYQEITLAEVFAMNPSYGLTAIALWYSSYFNREYTYALGYTAGGSIAVGGASVECGLAFHKGEIRAYYSGSAELGASYDYLSKNLGKWGANAMQRFTLIKGDLNAFAGQSFSIGLSAGVKGVAIGGSLLWQWPFNREDVTPVEYLADRDNPKYSYVKKDFDPWGNLYGFTFEMGAGTPGINAIIGFAESTLIDRDKTIESVRKISSLFDIIMPTSEKQVTFPPLTPLKFDDLMEHYRIQISANTDPANVKILGKLYKTGCLIYFYDECEVGTPHKYFLPVKYGTSTAEFNEITKIANALGTYFPEKQKPFIVRYNKTIDAITDKYSAYSGKVLWTNLELSEIPVFDIKKYETKTLEFKITNYGCSNIEIKKISCESPYVSIREREYMVIDGNSTYSIEVTYRPQELGELEIPIKITTVVGDEYEFKIKSNVLPPN